MNRYERPCGCYHDGAGHSWVRCEAHKHEEEIEKRLEDTFGIPVCPDGCGDVRRPKCLWEAADCPRHAVSDRWKRLKKAAIEFAPSPGGEER